MGYYNIILLLVFSYFSCCLCEIFNYFAYGSNLTGKRLKINSPSSEFYGVATLEVPIVLAFYFY